MAKKRTYPPGTTFGNYFLSVEKIEGNEGYSIRRRVTLPDGKVLQPRYPAKLYKGISDRLELEQLVNRLNHRNDAQKKKNIEYRTSFIPNEVMEAFREHLKINIPNEKGFRYAFNTLLKSYFLGFFIGRLKIYDPQEWPKHQEKWAASLLTKSEDPDHNVFGTMVASEKTIRHVVQVANRFMAFLKQKMPNDYPLIVFEPLSAGALKAHSAELELKREEEIGRFITDADWKTIDEALGKTKIGPYVRLMYYYGLRRAESLGFDSMTAVKKGFLDVEKQVKAFTDGQPVYSALKDREKRRTPHWFCKPIDAYKFIEAGLYTKCHPDTLSEKWDQLMDKLKLNYKMHDLRRTFITKALRTQVPRDVQLAVGHSSLVTTMGYAQDDRSLEEEVFDPSKSA